MAGRRAEPEGATDVPPGDVRSPDIEYDAFVSYRRSDGSAAARWIRRELEGFRAPKALRERFDGRLKVYLDTAYERGTTDFYEHNIRPALLASRYLIVVATPDAVRRPRGADDWIEREIEDFSRGPNAGNLVVARARGELLDPLPADLAIRFPHLEIVDLRGAIRFWYLMPPRAARLADEKLKLIGPLTGLPASQMPLLRQEEERRQQARLGATVGVTLAILVAVSGFAVMALRSRIRAESALQSSLFATGRTVLSISDLDPRGDLAELRSGILNESCDLIDKLRAQATQDPGIAELTTCALERALERERQGEPDAARAGLADAVRQAEMRASKTSSVQSGRAVLEARRALADFLHRQGDLPSAEEELETLVARADEFTAQFDYDDPFLLSAARALEARGTIAEQQGRSEDALADRVEAERRHRDAEGSLLGRHLAASARDRSALLERIAEMEAAAGRPKAAALHYVAAAEASARAAEASEEDAPTWHFARDEARQRGRAALTFVEAGDLDQGLAQARAGLGRVAEGRAADETRDEALVDSSSLLAIVASIELDRGAPEAAQAACRTALDDLSHAVASEDPALQERTSPLREALGVLERRAVALSNAPPDDRER